LKCQEITLITLASSWRHRHVITCFKILKWIYGYSDINIIGAALAPKYSNFSQLVYKIRDSTYILVFLTKYLSRQVLFLSDKFQGGQSGYGFKQARIYWPSSQMGNAKNIPFDQLIYAWESGKKHSNTLLWPI
jgi:hypothetical protein